MTQTGYRNGAIGKKGNGQADKYKQDRKKQTEKCIKELFTTFYSLSLLLLKIYF